MIVMKTAESEIFEEAYFVLRRSCERSRDDIVDEANRIIEKCDTKRGGNGKRILRVLYSVGLFLGGGAFGGGIVALIIF